MFDDPQSSQIRAPTGTGNSICKVICRPECFNDWRGRGYDDIVPAEVTETTPSGDTTT